MQQTIVAGIGNDAGANHVWPGSSTVDGPDRNLRQDAMVRRNQSAA
jgi:hypothetical protein